MNEPPDASASKTPSEGTTPGHGFVPPVGWSKSANLNTSRFAFEMSNTTPWYQNDGQGTGYFAPGWDNERIARRTGVLRWIGVALAALILGIGAFHFVQQYAQQTTYTNIKGDGVETTAVVGPVDVEHARGRAQHTFGKYITRTTASISYVVHGRTLESDITASRSMRRPLDAEILYPPPAWSTGEQVVLYVDPVRPESFVVFHEFKEEDAESIPRGAVVVMISTGAALLLPMVLIIAGIRNVSKARRL